MLKKITELGSLQAIATENVARKVAENVSSYKSYISCK